MLYASDGGRKDQVGGKRPFSYETGLPDADRLASIRAAARNLEPITI
jgi:hypothetical protein